MTTTPTDELATIFREALEQDPACSFAAPACLSRIALRQALIVGDHAEAVVTAHHATDNAPPAPPDDRPSLSAISTELRRAADLLVSLPRGVRRPYRGLFVEGSPIEARLRDEADHLDGFVDALGQLRP